MLSIEMSMSSAFYKSAYLESGCHEKPTPATKLHKFESKAFMVQVMKNF